MTTMRPRFGGVFLYWRWPHRRDENMGDALGVNHPRVGLRALIDTRVTVHSGHIGTYVSGMVLPMSPE